MEPHMIENELFSYLFVIVINHVGFMFKFTEDFFNVS
jgi:hypothetical protein